MDDSSLEDLKRRIAAGEYAIDSRELAGDILSKLALVRRVGRFLAREGEDEQQATGEAGPGRRRRTRGGSPSAPARPLKPRREQPQ